MLDEVIEAWETNQRINEMVLAGVPKEGLSCSLSKRGGRDVARQFAHLHTQRLRFLEAKGGADLAYFVAHESHHRGSVLLTLKECGHPADKKTLYGIWDWHRR